MAFDFLVVHFVLAVDFCFFLFSLFFWGGWFFGTVTVMLLLFSDVDGVCSWGCGTDTGSDTGTGSTSFGSEVLVLLLSVPVPLPDLINLVLVTLMPDGIDNFLLQWWVHTRYNLGV